MGGAERSFSRIRSSLALAGQDVAIAIRAVLRLPIGSLSGVTQFELPFRTVWDPWSRASISRLIRQRRADIVQTYMGRANTTHPSPNLSAKAPCVARLCGNYKTREYFRHAHAWIACTRGCRPGNRAYRSNRLGFIPNFLPPTPMATAIELRDARERWGFAEDDLVCRRYRPISKGSGLRRTAPPHYRELPVTLDGCHLLVLAREPQSGGALRTGRGPQHRPAR